MTPLVIDASAGVELVLNTSIGRRLGARISGLDPWVPDLFYTEVGGVLRRMELAGTITVTRANLAIDRLLALRARRVDVKPLIRDVWALRHNITIADAVYVILARHLAAGLVTGDRRLARAPAAALGGITLITP